MEIENIREQVLNLNFYLKDKEIMQRVIHSQESAGLCDFALCKIAAIDVANYCNRKRKWSRSTIMYLNKICKVLWLSFDEVLFHPKMEIGTLAMIMENCPSIEKEYVYEVLVYYLSIYHQNETYFNNGIKQIEERLVKERRKIEQEPYSIISQSHFPLKKYVMIEKNIPKYTLKDFMLLSHIYEISLDEILHIKEDAALLLEEYQNLAYFPLERILIRYIISFAKRNDVSLLGSRLQEFDTIDLVAMGKRIQRRRLEQGMVAQKAAEICDLSLNKWSRIENGKSNIILRTLYKISIGLSMTANEIVWGPMHSLVDWKLLKEKSSLEQREFFDLIQTLLSVSHS